MPVEKAGCFAATRLFCVVSVGACALPIDGGLQKIAYICRFQAFLEVNVRGVPCIAKKRLGSRN